MKRRPLARALTLALAVALSITVVPSFASTASASTADPVTLTGDLDFGEVPLGTDSPPRTLTLTNKGSGAISIVAFGAERHNPPFIRRVGGSCGWSVAPNSSCTIDVVARPYDVFQRIDDFFVEFDDGVRLTATATVHPTSVGVDVSVSTPNVDFGQVEVGTQSALKPVTFTNRGDMAARFGDFSGLNGPFGIAPNSDRCVVHAWLPAGKSCTLLVGVVPTAPGAVTQVVTVAFLYHVPAQTFTVSATGVAGSASLAGDLTFGQVPYSTESPVKTVTITNTGNAQIQLTRISGLGSTAGPIRHVAGSCLWGMYLAPKASCTIGVVAIPSVIGTQTATLRVEFANGVPAVTADAAVSSYFVNASARNLNLGEVPVGKRSSLKPVTFTNVSGVPLRFAGIGAFNGPFWMTGGPGLCAWNTVLPAGKSCSFYPVANPLMRGTFTATTTVTFLDGVPAEQFTVTATGI